jgi:putative hydrolase of the HAD superfamily
MTRVVFFDAAGTLIHLPKGVGHHYSTIFRKYGLILDENALGNAFRAAWKRMPPRKTTKTPRPDDDKRWWRDLVRQVLGEFPAPGAEFDFDACFEELYLHFAMPGVWELYPEVMEVLAKLRAKYRLGIISNFDGRLRTVLAHLGILEIFDVVILSSEAGADKPDPHIFQVALAAMNMQPAEALHTGDDPVHDWAAAELLGMSVYRLKRPENSLLGIIDMLEA